MVVTGLIGLVTATLQAFVFMPATDEMFVGIWAGAGVLCAIVVRVEMQGRSRRHHSSLATAMINQAIEQFCRPLRRAPFCRCSCCNSRRARRGCCRGCGKFWSVWVFSHRCVRCRAASRWPAALFRDRIFLSVAGQPRPDVVALADGHSISCRPDADRGDPAFTPRGAKMTKREAALCL